MARTRDTHRSHGRTPQGATCGAVLAGGQQHLFDRDVRVPALSLSDHRGPAASAVRTSARRVPTSSALPELLVAERSA